jgi:hypothetical protein
LDFEVMDWMRAYFHVEPCCRSCKRAQTQEEARPWSTGTCRGFDMAGL